MIWKGLKNLSNGSWIKTYTGKKFDYIDIEKNEIDIKDIAHALSLLNRYTGHTKKFYCVAQHSILVSKILEKKDKLAGLLHDASEAYLGDINTPLKILIPEYIKIEKSVQDHIYKCFKIEKFDAIKIHKADKIILATEKRDLIPNIKIEEWNLSEKPLKDKIRVDKSPVNNEMFFLDEFYKLYKTYR